MALEQHGCHTHAVRPRASGPEGAPALRQAARRAADSGRAARRGAGRARLGPGHLYV